MSFLIHRNEPLADRRRVPIWLVTSDGTTPDTGATADACNFSINGAAPITATNTLSATSAASGQYYIELDQSETSVLGSIRVIHNIGSFVQSTELIQVVADDPFENFHYTSSGESVLQGATASSVTLASGETTLNDYFNGGFLMVQVASGEWMSNIISDYTGSNKYATVKNTWPLTPTSTSTYVVFAGTPETNLSASTIQGVTRVNSSVTIANATYSAVSVRLDSVTHSGATVGVGNIAAGTYSGVTVQGVTRVNSSVTPADATYSAVTVRIDPQNYSGLTVGVDDIAAGSYSGVTIDGLTAGGEQGVANSLLSTNLGDDRLVQEAIFALRNRVDATGNAAGASVMTVYLTDDVTSAWTASIGTAPSGGINSINPL